LLPQALSVRGAPRAQSKAHGRLLRRPPIPADIYDKVSGDMQKQGCDCECLGGGRISHQSQDKKIHVYGYSMMRPTCVPLGASGPRIHHQGLWSCPARHFN
uniref:14 kDa phosphohistidine phosphatase n=1 Tax=Pan paniscus TaxID=9597 RepID=A0A2R9CEN8_PANPA